MVVSSQKSSENHRSPDKKSKEVIQKSREEKIKITE